jgi:octaprenyl-diphosphate synthase
MSSLPLQLKAELTRGLVKTRWMDKLHGPLDIPEVSKIEQVCSLLWERKGKRLRSQWVYWFGEAWGVPANQLKLYAWAVEAIHTATLLHDDVIDKAPLRRGGPSANEIFDNTLPVLSGDYLLSDAIFQLSDSGHPLLVKLMCRAVKELTQGEVLQYEHQYRIPQNEQYYETLNRLKTSALLHWAAQVGSVLKTGKENSMVSEIAFRYGALYQLTDDVLDVRGTPTKKSWQDLREGKVNEVVFLLFNTYPEIKDEWEPMLSERCFNPDCLQKLQKFAQDSAFQEILKSRLEAAKEKCLQSIRSIPHSQMKAILEKLTCFTVDRLS